MLKGLSEENVRELRNKFGENVLPVKEGHSWISILFSQFKSPLIYVLIFVVLISLFLKEYTDVALVAVVIVVNAVLGFYQEYNAQRTLAALRKILKPKTWVIREDQRKEIEVKELVPGDLVVISAGDRVPADGKLIEGLDLLVNEAMLTGEEEAISKNIKSENNLLFMGTTAISGRGIMEVKETGISTKMGKIGESLAEIKETKTPLQLKLESFIKSLALIILGVCFLIFIVGVLHDENILEMLRISVILSVAAIPEGLPIAITVILALGMRRILKRDGLVKKLLSIETLGSTSVICTDKTGTLTEGKMQVVKTDLDDPQKANYAMILGNEEKSSLEVALYNYVKKEGIFDFKETVEKIYEDPFDSEKKYALMINKIKGKKIAYLRGAPEIILKFCNLSSKEREEFTKKIEEWGGSGLRVIGTAYKDKGNLKEKSDYHFIGLIGIEDPVREEAKQAIKIAQKAGIKVKIVTGDYYKTAEAVARKLGLEVDNQNIMEGEELETIFKKELKNRIDKIILFARVTPHQKLKIIQVLQEKGEIVAMTGDGINDAPALKKSDIGVVVGDATDVAKETGDLILLDNNFKTIVAACEEGRLIFSNIKKVVGYVLSNSFSEIILIFGALLLNYPPPLTVVQILWIHLICDGPPDILLGFEGKEKTIMQERPQEMKKEHILSGTMKFLILAISLTAGLSAFLIFRHYNNEGNLDLARTIAFATIGTVSLVYIFSFKNLKKLIIQTENFFENKALFWGVAYGFLLIFAAVYLPGLNHVLKTVPLGFTHWLLVFGVAAVATFWVEIAKLIGNRKKPGYS